MTAMLNIPEAKELDARSSDGIDVRLLWEPATDKVRVAVVDWSNQTSFEVTVKPSQALDAFQHPFAYAAFLDVPFDAPSRAADEEPVAA